MRWAGYFSCNRLILPADAIEKVRYILDPNMKDEQSLSNRKGGYDEKEKMLYIHQSIHDGSDKRVTVWKHKSKGSVNTLNTEICRLLADTVMRENPEKAKKEDRHFRR